MMRRCLETFVLRRAQQIGDPIDAQLLLKEKPKDAEPGFFTQGFQGRNAVDSRHRMTLYTEGRRMSQLALESLR
jgi:hypothetical protein